MAVIQFGEYKTLGWEEYAEYGTKKAGVSTAMGSTPVTEGSNSYRLDTLVGREGQG